MNFLYGVLASLCASFIAWWVAQARARSRLRGLEGDWIEIIEGSERPLSLVRLRFHRFWGVTGHHIFEGENYYPDGRVYCKYRSVSIHCDRHESKVFYIYRFDILAEPGSETWGFGFLNIGTGRDGKPTLVSGHYRSSKPDAEPRGTKMKRLSDAAEEINADLASYESDEDRAKFVRTYCSIKQLAPKE